MCNKSESISKLAVALVKFNGEVSKISKDSDNPFFKSKYATLDNIIDEVRPILTSHGLSILQFPSGDGDKVTMKTMLLHESGEWIESDPISMKPVKNDPQAVGSSITYARRYGLSSFLSLNTGEEDDGNNATHGKQQSKPQYNKPQSKPQQPSRPQQNGAQAITPVIKAKYQAVFDNLDGIEKYVEENGKNTEIALTQKLQEKKGA